MVGPSIDPNTPVIIGAGQYKQKPEDPLDALEPVAMMAAAAEAAIRDAGSPYVGDRRIGVRVVNGAWPYRDPGRLMMDLLGLECVRSGVTADGGQVPMELVGRAALELAAGAIDVVFIAGGEGIYTRRRARRAGLRIPYTDDARARPADRIGPPMALASPRQQALGLSETPPVYALFESAIAHANERSPAEHTGQIAAMWSRFSEVAEHNPYAWSPQAVDADQIATPSPANRMVATPYTKLMCSNWDLDLAAALVMTTAATADELGVHRDHWIFPYAVATAHDGLDVASRESFTRSPSIQTCGEVVLAHARRDIDLVDHLDLYSCYPSAVQIAAAELGVTDGRPLTVTGGLTFAGGPLNNYVTHSVATMVGLLRQGDRRTGLVTANGGYVTKHAIGLFRNSPPLRPFRYFDQQPTVNQHPLVRHVVEYEGPATIEACTVVHDRATGTVAAAAVRTPDDSRMLALNHDVKAHSEFAAIDMVGLAVDVRGDEFEPAG